MASAPRSSLFRSWISFRLQCKRTTLNSLTYATKHQCIHSMIFYLFIILIELFSGNLQTAIEKIFGVKISTNPLVSVLIFAFVVGWPSVAKKLSGGRFPSRRFLIVYLGVIIGIWIGLTLFNAVEIIRATMVEINSQM